MNPYQTCALEGASGVELTIALYDGIRIRFMYRAIDAVERRGGYSAAGCRQACDGHRTLSTGNAEDGYRWKAG